ncbi:RING-H2 finger protein ATL39-like [Punica granatum]|uniref:RING-type E3 ubiquitin transferase n=2 Tax=Punica granatum TaxID=22663 RepID=A0A218WXA2_PUNGR|nr:RING-H2 finger protein ATL39-like [Punica granatum]OWM77283.1 hypothetical protein CDL15_Pgr028920 [Punica granatum]PKI51832.1 hypothetical protein CRG98_027750 [Punica granatum]
MIDSPVSPYGLPAPLPPPPPSPSLPHKSNLPMLYYGLVVVGTAAVVLAVYNLIIIKWCTHRSSASAQAGPRFVELTGGSQSFEHPGRNLLSSFKYKKEAAQENGELECAVCLSVVEDGEEIRRLPRCKHTFHVSCIDMWLYSHSDCPLCRAPAVPPLSRGLREPANSPENSREGLLPRSIAMTF